MIWRLLLLEALAVLTILGVWFGAPLVGITSVLWRIVIIIALLLPPLILVLVVYLQRRKAASGLESAIKEQGKVRQESVRPDRRAEVQALSEGFDQAVTALKKSRLGHGRSALYALPWYMIIGPPAVGKTTALLRSGLKFPFTTGERKLAKVKGVGGTRNCDWWFSEQAILLDTAGRYTSEDDDTDEWLSFLRLLKKYRRKRPLNGLIVAVAVSDLMNASPEELEEQAAQIRSRIDQVIGQLEVALPVYVLFTKSDLIYGFTQFFGNLSKSARSQVLGFTVPLAGPETKIEELFNTEFDLLMEQLHRRSLARLAASKSAQRSATYQFPLQFEAIRDTLSSFVSHLMVSNPYVECPRLRGVYFCSGTQEGRPQDRVLTSMSQALGLRELAAESFGKTTQKKSYFLKHVFTEVLVPDRDLAGTTARGLSRRRKLGIAGLVAAMLLSAGVVAPAVISYSNNAHLAESAVDVSKRSRITVPEDPRKVLDGLQALDELGSKLDQLLRYREDGAPWSHSFGFYRGDELLPHVQRVYVRRMRQAFVLPVGTELEATLADVASSPESSALGATADFELLKTYLMVTEPKRLDAEVATPVLLAQWKKRLHPDVAQHRELLASNANRYMALLSAGQATWLERDEELVHKVRQTLIGRDTQYRTLVAGVEERVRPFTLRDALRGRIQTAVTAEHEVPGIYTRAAWNRHIRPRLAKRKVTGSKADGWVLGMEEGKDATEQLRERYFERYIIAWEKFLKGLSVAPATTPEESLILLEKLTEPPPVYEELFASVAHNTQMPVADKEKLKKASKMLRGRAGRAIRKAERLGLDESSIPSGPKNTVERHFQPLHEMVSSESSVDGRPQVSGIKQYLVELDNVRASLAKVVQGGGGGEEIDIDRQIEEARRVAKGVLATLPGDLRRTVAGLLYAPLDVAGSKATEAQAMRASATISDDLCGPFKQRLGRYYPFAPGGEDALLQDVVAFFAPQQGALWTTFESSFKGQLVRRGNAYRPQPGKHVPDHVVAFFNRGWKVTQALFPPGSNQPHLRLKVRPHPAVLDADSSYQVGEIVLDIEGTSHTYRNGPPEEWNVQWTGEGSRALLLIRGANGLQEKIQYRGEWGLRRLIDRGTVRKRGSWYRVIWSFRDGKIRVPMDFRPGRTYNPLFSSLRLPCP